MIIFYLNIFYLFWLTLKGILVTLRRKKFLRIFFLIFEIILPLNLIIVAYEFEISHQLQICSFGAGFDVYTLLFT